MYLPKSDYSSIIAIPEIVRKYKISRRNLNFYHSIGILPCSLHIEGRKLRGYKERDIRRLGEILRMCEKPPILTEAMSIWDKHYFQKYGEKFDD